MSLLVYTGTHVVADRKAICQNLQYMNCQYIKKLHVSSCKRFAYGCVGLIMPEIDKPFIEKMILEKITMLRTGSPPSEHLDLFFKEFLQENNRELMVVTQDEGFVFTDSKTITMGPLEGYGTGALTFMTAYRINRDIYQAYYIAEHLIPTVGMENYEQPDVVDIQKDLVPFLLVDQKAFGKAISNLGEKK